MRCGRAFILASGLVVFSLFSEAAPAAEKPARARITERARSLPGDARALVHGTFVRGFRQTKNAIKAKPIRYGAMVLGLSLAGAAAKAGGVDPHWWAIGLSTAVTARQSWKSLPKIKLARGRERLSLIGKDIVWPSFLVAATAGLGSVIPHFGHGGGPPSGAELAGAGLRTGVITLDVPTVVMHGLGED